MAKHKRRGGRATPKGTRPNHLRSVAGPTLGRDPTDDLIDPAARELLGTADPVSAETWASNIVNLFDKARMAARLDGQEIPPFEVEIIERCRQRRDQPSLAVAAALGSVLSAPFDDAARRVAADLERTVRTLPWIDAIGRAVPTRAYVGTDAFGDSDLLLIGFANPDGRYPHAVVVLVDHNLSGQAKDAWIAADLDQVVAMWETTHDEHMRLTEVPVSDALDRLQVAMRTADLFNGDTHLRSDEFAGHRSMIWARLRRAGHGSGHGDSPEISRTTRDALVAEFLASEVGSAAVESAVEADVELIASYLVDLRCDYEGRPLRWSPIVVETILVDLAPRKLLLGADDAAALPGVLRALVRFAAARTHLDQVFVDETLLAIDHFEPDFLRRIGDPAAAGPAKAVLSALQARGVDLNDLDATQAALQSLEPINLPEATPIRRRNPSGASRDVVESAAHAPVRARFATLTAFFGEGRKLTQTGQPTLADARALVESLPTGDRFDETIGDRAYKTKSATELPELGFMIRWAITAGALRKQGGKLKATATWAKLETKPLEQWMRAADALRPLGPLAAFFAHARYRDSSSEILDEIAAPLLSTLQRGPVTYDSMLDHVCAYADETYEWTSDYFRDPERRRTSFGWDLDLFLRIVGWAGIAVRLDATEVPDRWTPARKNLIGGRVQLTPVGRWWFASAT